MSAATEEGVEEEEAEAEEEGWWTRLDGRLRPAAV